MFMNKAKKVKCEVCGYKFVPCKEKVYVCIGSTGVFERIETSLVKCMQQVNVIDCPQCGCQKMLSIRMPAVSNERDGEKQ